MARIRSIHPSQWTDEEFLHCSAFARLLAIGLRNEADDRGAFEWKPIGLKIRLFPVDDVDMAALLDELITHNQIVRYAVDGKHYGAIRNFCRFQSPKAPKYTFPLPDDFRIFVGLTPPNGELFGDDGNGFPPKGETGAQRDRSRSRRGIGGDSGSARAHALPDDFAPVLTDDAQAIVDQWPDGLLKTELSKFKDHHIAKGSEFKCWQAAFRTWIRNVEKWKGDNRVRSGTRQDESEIRDPLLREYVENGGTFRR
jgi:hypothetical protein